MKLLLIIIGIAFFTAACSQKDLYYTGPYFNEEVRLLDSNIYKNDYLAIGHKAGDYEIRIPLSILQEYLKAATADSNFLMAEYAKEIEGIKKEGAPMIYSNSNIGLDKCSLCILDKWRFFKNGDFLLYNRLARAYEGTAQVYLYYGFEAGSMSICTDIIIKAGGKVIYEYHNEKIHKEKSIPVY